MGRRGCPMIRVAICDDEKLMTAKIEELVIQAAVRRGVRTAVDVFYSGSGLMDYIRRGHEYDLIFLDIEMPDMDGIEFARNLRSMSSEAVLVYISAHTEYAIQLFDVETFRFLTKPVDEKTFMQVFHKACDKILSGNRFFTYTSNKTVRRVRMGSILYFESRGRQVQIVTTNESISFYGRLDEVEERLASEHLEFLRIHKSFLVNMEHVEKLSCDRVRLRSGEELRISQERQKLIQRQYLWKDGG